MTLKTNNYANDPRNIALRDWCNEVRGRGAELARRLYDNNDNNSMAIYKYGTYPISDSLQTRLDVYMKQIEKEEKHIGVKKIKVKNTSSYMHKESIRAEQSKRNKVKFLTECLLDDNFIKFYTTTSKYYLANKFDLYSYTMEKEFPYSLYLSMRRAKNIYDEKNAPGIITSLLIKWLKSNKKQKSKLFNVVYSLNFGRKKQITTNHLHYFLNKPNSYCLASSYANVQACIKKVDNMIATKHRFALAAK